MNRPCLLISLYGEHYSGTVDLFSDMSQWTVAVSIYDVIRLVSCKCVIIMWSCLCKYGTGWWEGLDVWGLHHSEWSENLLANYRRGKTASFYFVLYSISFSNGFNFSTSLFQRPHREKMNRIDAFHDFENCDVLVRCSKTSIIAGHCVVTEFSLHWRSV